MTDYGSGNGYTVVMEGPFPGGGGSSSVILATINTPVASWKGATSPYSQVVNVENISVNHKVELSLSAAQIEALSGQIIHFTAENNGGIVTVYAIGDKPATDCEFQASLTEVMINPGDGNFGSIRGNTVGTVNPRANWNQNDADASNFVENKPVDALNEALTKAKAALPKTGGTMTGDIAMSGKKVTGLGDPVNNGDATSKKYVDGKTQLFNATLTASGWSANAPYTQTVAVNGVLNTDCPHVGLVTSDNKDTAEAEEEAWGCVSKGVANDNSITFTCWEDKPEINLNLQIEVNR